MRQHNRMEKKVFILDSFGKITEKIEKQLSLMKQSRLHEFLNIRKPGKMSCLIQRLTNSRTYETLKQVQADKSRLFTRPSRF
jgi:hypothetical protein